MTRFSVAAKDLTERPCHSTGVSASHLMAVQQRGVPGAASWLRLLPGSLTQGEAACFHVVVE
jgi:hypothetical protein